MMGLRRPLVACTLAGVVLFLLPLLGDSPAESAERAALTHPDPHARTAQVKSSRSSYRKPIRPAPPEGILLKDLGTGETLYEQHADRLMPPASLTKIMSAVVILEEGNLD